MVSAVVIADTPSTAIVAGLPNADSRAVFLLTAAAVADLARYPDGFVRCVMLVATPLRPEGMSLIMCPNGIAADVPPLIAVAPLFADDCSWVDALGSFLISDCFSAMARV